MSPGPDLSAATWRKSSYSDGGANNCVEVSGTFPDLVPVRDSKTPTAPALTFGPIAWTAFIEDIREEHSA